MINTVGIVGLGAVGGMYAKHLTDFLTKEYVKVIADRQRIDRYKKDGVFINGENFDFAFLYAEEKSEPLDLIIIATKFHQLGEAIENVKNYVGENTIILSAINGISSEAIIAEHFGEDRVLYCVAQGMDAVKDKNHISYSKLGKLAFGEKNNAKYSRRVEDVVRIFERAGFPYEVPLNMDKRLWGKFMLNVGINQIATVFDVPYGGTQVEGEPRETMLRAMREVMDISKYTGVNLDEGDFEYWVKVNDSLTPSSMPSMRQDVLAKRKTEVEIFGGEVVKLGKRYNVKTPVNDFLVEKIKSIENGYLD